MPRCVANGAVVRSLQRRLRRDVGIGGGRRRNVKDAIDRRVRRGRRVVVREQRIAVAIEHERSALQKCLIALGRDVER